MASSSKKKTTMAKINRENAPAEFAAAPAELAEAPAREAD